MEYIEYSDKVKVGKSYIEQDIEVVVFDFGKFFGSIQIEGI